MIYFASLERSLFSLIPVGHDVFDLRHFHEEKLVNVSVLADYFSWDVWTQLPSILDRNVIPPCLVMGSDPVDRVVSYYYQRCYHVPTCPHYNLPFNNLTVSELTSFLVNYRHDVPNADGDLGIVDDATCRALANRKMTTDQSINLTEWEQGLALKNVESCVVGLQDDWDNTKRMIDHWFPWIEATKRQEKWQTKKQQQTESVEIICPLLRQIVEGMNPCDSKLYEKMKSLFKKQLLVLETDAYL
jgi:hypothetical protein